MDEKLLVSKTYYSTFLLEGDRNLHPVQILGEAYLTEQKQDVYDLSFVRFAQGEVYFHNKDYEAAIFKWENISNELQPWAKKNIADSYYELELLFAAEDIYNSIDPESKTLSMEIAIKLFALYVEREKMDLAYEVLKVAIALDPDYANITEAARLFYEEREDWNNAVELSVNEFTRTGDPAWFQALKRYVDGGSTRSLDPQYFYETLTTLYTVNPEYFSQLAVSLWKSYRYQENYLQWLKTLNTVFRSINLSAPLSWKNLSAMFEETYIELIDGKYFISEIEGVVPGLLENWMLTADQDRKVFASAAIMAWNEVFPSTISLDSLKGAESIIFNSVSSVNNLPYIVSLFESIMKWAKTNHINVGYKVRWLVQQLADAKSRHFFVVGDSGSGKTSFMNSLLDDPAASIPSADVVMLSGSREAELYEISDSGKKQGELKELESSSSSWVHAKQPSSFLETHSLVLIHTPVMDQMGVDGKGVKDYLPLADGILYLVNARTRLSNAELENLLEIRGKAGHIPIHFVLNKMDAIVDENEIRSIISTVEDSVHDYFPEALVFPYSSLKAVEQQRAELAKFIGEGFTLTGREKEEMRTAQLLYYIRTTLTELLDKRAETENALQGSISFNEDILSRLKGLVHKLNDMEGDKVTSIKASYQDIKREMDERLKEKLPSLLRDCSKELSEDDDFSTIHIELNNKMNVKIQDYLREELVPQYAGALEIWIQESKEELSGSQEYLSDMSDTFNALYRSDKINLSCDFGIFADWERDIQRMLNRTQVEKENILNRTNPAQLLLKGAGRLFGALPQNKTLLFNQYKKYIESESYSDVAASVSHNFFLQFDMFERSIQPDIHSFFREPAAFLRETIKEVEGEIQRDKETMSVMKANPKLYYDPLKLFEVRLLQYEFIIEAHKETVYGK
ncbi:GTP-binding protein [Bacillus lacus]|uniref:GTP-binding protein n=1 Tax=Metabacillus lacus TaxID=1983721 RepID=A0A7X2IZR5_9BACI|nr:GTPase domain-containing protein [Metabacillus lacus]MRX72462.1 GTP-binding protein [Metabacillus lacus]